MKIRKIIGIGILAILTLILGLVLLAIFSPKTAEKLVEKGMENIPQTVEIMNEEVEVPPLGYWAVNYPLSNGMKIHGVIEVTEGDNVHFYLTDGEGYNNFQNRKEFRSYLTYKSTRIQSFSFEAPYTTTFYIILENPAIFKKKKVQVNISITATLSQLRKAGLIKEK